MKVVYIATLALLCSFFVSEQVESQNVVHSDISGVYKQRVKTNFYNELNKNYTLAKGYHGMLDLGYSIGCGSYTFNRFEINTTHGYQFNPYVFLGGGIGFHFMSQYNINEKQLISFNYRYHYIDLPIFADAKFTLINGTITPFVDAKAGFFITHGGGTYINGSVGCRFAVWGRQAFNISIGYTYENLQFDTYKGFVSQQNIAKLVNNKKKATFAISLRIGYEF